MSFIWTGVTAWHEWSQTNPVVVIVHFPQELDPLMANPVPDTTTDPKKQHSSEKNEQHPADSSASLQSIKAKIFKGVSYFAGDMRVYGEWMKGKMTAVLYPAESYIHVDHKNMINEVLTTYALRVFLEFRLIP